MKGQQTELIRKQREICDKYGFEFEASDLNLKVGISSNVKDNVQPIHALRYQGTEDTTGWYIWAGEYSDADDFFQPLHVVHLDSWCPLILPYLGLPPASRILIAENGNYVDVWEDRTLLEM
ncbi:hypothetical protein [Pedobacter sp.]|uniref:immunity protein Imm33 domain-containing protein n=1 Tax=Pedobacter sp. TaxID=1411316 RepID=UPI00396C64E0